MKVLFMKVPFYEGCISLFYEGFIWTVPIPDFLQSAMDLIKNPLHVEWSIPDSSMHGLLMIHRQWILSFSHGFLYLILIYLPGSPGIE